MIVPILVYFFGVAPSNAPISSLAIVGVLSFLGSFRNFGPEGIHPKLSFSLALPGIVGIYWARNDLIHRLPESFEVFGFSINKDLFVMLTFGAVMLASGVSMIRKSVPLTASGLKQGPLVFLKLGLAGFLIGILAGVTGAGGGFLIVPALVIIGGMPIKPAVVTSLFTIAVQSVVGIGVSTQKEVWITELQSVFPVFLASLVGLVLGTRLRHLASPQTLKKVFGFFIIAMSVVIFLIEAQRVF